MSETKSIYDSNKKQEISEKVEGKKWRTDQKQVQKKSFKVKRNPAGKITAAAFNTRTLIVTDSVTEYQSVRQNSTKMLFISVLWRERLHTATALQTELLYLFYWLCCFSVVDWKKTRLLPAHFLTMTFPFLFLSNFHFQTLLYIYQDRF